MTVRRTYLDYNATAPLRAEARAAMIAALDLVGNPSSVHAEGRRARAALEAARAEIAALIGASAADLVFTSGASEANATVIAGGWRTIVLSGLEHDSVRVAAARSGARLVHVPVTSDGVFDVAAFERLAADCDGALDGALVCLQLANSETGVIQPVRGVATIARERGMRLHCDAVQALSRMPVDCKALGADYVTVSAHKIGGPRGAGALVAVDGAPLPSLIAGGGQERGRRAGTENVGAIVGFAAAARGAIGDLAEIAGVAALRDRLEAGVRRITPEAMVIGASTRRLPNTACIAKPGSTAESLLIKFDLAGVAISAGSACSSGKVGQSATLAAMGLGADVARAAIRVSLGAGTTGDDVAAFLDSWQAIAGASRRAA